MEKTEENTAEYTAIYAPMEEIRCFERVVDMLEIVYKEFRKVAEGMSSIKNYE